MVRNQRPGEATTFRYCCFIFLGLFASQLIFARTLNTYVWFVFYAVGTANILAEWYEIDIPLNPFYRTFYRIFRNFCSLWFILRILFVNYLPAHMGLK